MKQTRWMSAIEQLLNIGSGFIISLAVWEWIVKPVWDIHTNFAENLTITGVFTVVSLCRGYIWRRVFNGLLDKNNKKEAAHAQGPTTPSRRCGNENNHVS